MKPLIIFDADGVLLNSFSLAMVNYNILSDKYNLPIVKKKEDFDFIFSGYLKTSLQKFNLDKSLSKQFFDEHSALMRKDFNKIEPFYEVINCIKENKDKYDFSIASSAYSNAIVNILQKSPLYKNDLFIKIMGRETNLSKSEKITLLKGSNGNCIYIGDMVSDILYCKDSYTKIAVVGYGYNTLPFLNSFNPDFSLLSEKNLCDFLNYSLTF